MLRICDAFELHKGNVQATCAYYDEYNCACMYDRIEKIFLFDYESEINEVIYYVQMVSK